MSRKAALLHLFDQMEEERGKILAGLDVLPLHRSETGPAPDAWSVAQVISHLAIAEESALAYLNKKLEVKKHGPVGWSAVWRLFLLNTAVRLPIKYKAPAIVANIPATSYAKARERWDGVRLATRARYLDLDESLLDHDLYKHPIAGKFNLLQGLRFVREHVEHHQGQIQRVLRAVP